MTNSGLINKKQEFYDTRYADAIVAYNLDNGSFWSYRPFVGLKTGLKSVHSGSFLKMNTFLHKKA